MSLQTHSILEDYEVKWRQKLGCGVSGPVRPCKWVQVLMSVLRAFWCVMITGQLGYFLHVCLRRTQNKFSLVHHKMIIVPSSNKHESEGLFSIFRRKSDGKQFALKCLVDRPRARTEVTLHIKCSNHPHIVNVYDVYANEVQFPDEPFPRSVQRDTFLANRLAQLSTDSTAERFDHQGIALFRQSPVAVGDGVHGRWWALRPN